MLYAATGNTELLTELSTFEDNWRKNAYRQIGHIEHPEWTDFSLNFSDNTQKITYSTSENLMKSSRSSGYDISKQNEEYVYVYWEENKPGSRSGAKGKVNPDVLQTVWDTISQLKQKTPLGGYPRQLLTEIQRVLDDTTSACGH